MYATDRVLTPFRQSEMKYRRQLRSRNPTDFSEVIDFRNLDKNTAKNRELIEEVEITNETREKISKELFGNRENFKVYQLKGKSGFYFLNQPFNESQQKYWIKRCVCDYTARAQNSLEAHFDIPKETNLWSLFEKHEKVWVRKDVDFIESPEVEESQTTKEETSNSDASSAQEKKNEVEVHGSSVEVAENKENTKIKKFSGRQLFQKLRWLTLGYKYNWSEKEYKGGETPFPTDLSSFGKEIAKIFGFPEYSSESAIVNYYHYGDTLTGHTDRSELNHTAPIVSASFGHSAVFLLGDQTREEYPLALYVQSGDVVVMKGAARTAFHGIPRIVEGTLPPYLKDPSNDIGYSQSLIEYMSDTRVNMNVRQVF